MRLPSIQFENVLMKRFGSQSYLKVTVGSPLPQTMRTQPTHQAYSLGRFFFFSVRKSFLSKEEAQFHSYKTVPFNWHDRSQTVKSGLLWDLTGRVNMSGTSGSRKVFRGRQLLHKWQINGTSCLELRTDSKNSLYLSQTLGRLLTTPGALMLAVWLWSRSSLNEKKKRFLSLSQHRDCHVSVWTTGSNYTKMVSVTCFLKKNLTCCINI